MHITCRGMGLPSPYGTDLAPVTPTNTDDAFLPANGYSPRIRLLFPLGQTEDMHPRDDTQTER